MVNWSAVALMAVLVLIFFSYIRCSGTCWKSTIVGWADFTSASKAPPPDPWWDITAFGFLILEAMCTCFFCKGPKLDKDSRRGPDVVDLQQLIRIGQVVLLLLLILLLSTLPLLILGIVHRCFLMKKKSPSCVHVVVAVSTDLKKNFQLFPGAGRWPERASGLVDLCPAKWF